MVSTHTEVRVSPSGASVAVMAGRASETEAWVGTAVRHSWDTYSVLADKVRVGPCPSLSQSSSSLVAH